MRIIYIDLDSMRPDHFGCYGYHRHTTPNMDKIAERGVRFTGAYCSSSPCMPSRAGFMSGRFAVHHGVINHRGPGSHFRFPGEGHYYRPDMPLFTRYLRQNGFKTVSFSSFADRHQANWYYAGWSEMHTHTLKGGAENADEVNAAVLPWLKLHGAEDNYFLHIQYWDPHRDYTMPKEWADLFKDDPPPAWPDQAAIDSHQANHGVFSASQLFHSGKSPVATMPDRITTVSDFKKMVDGYDGAIRYMDHHIGQVFETLETLGVLDETAIIISGDHGEAMGEQGIYGDHVCAGEAVHNIPLIISWPGVTPGGAAYDGFLYHIDLLPTICELLDLDIPPRWDGTSFASAVRGGAWDGRSHLVWDHGLYCCQRAVRTREWLLTRTYHPGIYPFDDVILWEMPNDPHQETNVASKHPDVVRGLDHLMMEWLHQNLGRYGTGGDPLQEVVEHGPWCYVNPRRWIAHLEEQGLSKEAEAIINRLDVERDFVTPRGLRMGHYRY